MDDIQEDKLGMFQTVQGVLTSNQTHWQPIPKFVEGVNAFNGYVTTISDLAQSQEQTSTGVTQQKANARGAMADAALKVIGPLEVLATLEGDADLAAQAHYTLTDFLHGRDTDALTPDILTCSLRNLSSSLRPLCLCGK